MADEFVEIREMRERFMRAAYDRRNPAQLDAASHEDIMRGLGLDPDITTRNGRRDTEQYEAIVRYWEEQGFIEYFTEAMIRITARGIRYVEGDLEQQATPSVTFNVGNAYGSIFGTQQHAEMNVSFDFRTVEAELDRAEEEIEQRGGRDAAELKELIAEVRALHERGESVGRGRLARYLGVIQRNGWISGPVAGTLLSIAMGA
jgi:hypothetical protein